MFGLLYNFCPAIFAAMGAKPEVGAGLGAGGWVLGWVQVAGCWVWVQGLPWLVARQHAGGKSRQRLAKVLFAAFQSSAEGDAVRPACCGLQTPCPSTSALLRSTQVVVHAVAYMRMRCLASPAILMYYVLSGTFRGFKDTK